MNEIIRNLTIENFLNLKASYVTSKKIFWDEKKNQLVHPGEYGSYRERLVKRWLRIYVPKKFEISSGFLINSENKISTQCDIIIYDRDNTPQIQTIDDQVFFPIETVAIVGEIKSDIKSAKDLNTYLEKLSEVKKLRDDVQKPKPYFRAFSGDYNPAAIPYDNIFTFIICNKLNLDLTNNPINYECDPRNKHNAILSLHDGLIRYESKNGFPHTIPFLREEVFSENFCRNDGEELPSHVINFLSAIHTALDFTTLLEIDMARYLTNNLYDKNT